MSVDERFDPMPKEDRTIFSIEPTGVRNGLNWESVRGRASLVVHAAIDHVACGDEVLIFGRLVPLRPPTSPGQFNFQDFYRAQEQLARVHALFSESVVVEKRAPTRSHIALRSMLRSRLDALLWKYVDAENAGFASAILLGNREQMTPRQRDAFRATGTAHLLAISGLHVGIMASVFLLMYQFGILSRRWALCSTILFVVFYAWLVEFRPPVTRAAILLSLYCYGRLIGRTGLEFSLLAIAGILVLIINPADLFALGAQLSFLAIATLITFKDWIFPALSEDPIDRLIRNTRPWSVRLLQRVRLRVQQAFLVSALIWLIGLPLVALNFHLVTPIGLVVNPLVLIPIGLALFAGMCVCLFGIWLPAVAYLFGQASSVCLQIVTDGINHAESISGGHWWTAGPTAGSVAIYFLLLLAVVLFATKRRLQLLIVVWIAWLNLGWLVPFQAGKLAERIHQQGTNCTVVDVGHGSCVLLQLPHGKTVLYDAGSMTSSSFAADTISHVLWSKQIEHLDAIIISHADLDHFNAVPRLVRRFSVGQVFVSVPMFDRRDSLGSVKALFEEIAAADVPVRRMSCNQVAGLAGDARLRVLSPPDDGTDDSDNSDSIVLQIELGDHTILLTGDLEGKGMERLLELEDIDCDIVLMPHHGSKNSSPVKFVNWSQPKYAIISAGRNKTNREVISQIESDQCQVFTTADFGTIRMEIDRDQTVRVSHWSGRNWSQRSERSVKVDRY